MAEIADYQIITKGPFTLDQNVPEKELPFDLPVNISTSAGGVLGFVVDVSGGLFGATVDVGFEILSNNNSLTTYKLKSGTICSLLETFVGGGGKLKIGSNKIKVKLTQSNLAQLKVSDVVLWFQRNV